LRQPAATQANSADAYETGRALSARAGIGVLSNEVLVQLPRPNGDDSTLTLVGAAPS
jgi:hypothetical protein